MKQTRLPFERGFGYIAAILVLVILAGLAAGLMRLNITQQTTSSLDLESARAYQAAGAGIQWALLGTLTTAACPAAVQTLALGTGFNVTVRCTAIAFNEGETAPGVARTKTLFSINAVACNAANCPDNAAATGRNYIERRRVATACVSGALPALAAC